MIELYPSDTVPLPPTVEPLKQQLLHFMPISHNSLRIVGYTVVVKMTSQFGFGYFPQFNGLQSPGFLQPFLECSQLCGKLLAGSNPLHPKPFAVSRSTAIVGQAKKIKRLSPSSPSFSILNGKSPKLHHLGLRRFHLKLEFA